MRSQWGTADARAAGGGAGRGPDPRIAPRETMPQFHTNAGRRDGKSPVEIAEIAGSQA